MELRFFMVSVDCPVKYVVELERFTWEERSEFLAEVMVVRLLIKTKRATVVEIFVELVQVIYDRTSVDVSFFDLRLEPVSRWMNLSILSR